MKDLIQIIAGFKFEFRMSEILIGIMKFRKLD